MASKTEWEMHHRSPRTWLLDDGSTIVEPNIEITTGGRRVRSADIPSISGPSSRMEDVAFTSAIQTAKAQGRHIVCESHTLEDLKRWGRGTVELFDEPPLLHLANSVGADKPVAYYTTSYWSAWQHPALPIWFLTINTLETSYGGRQPTAHQRILSMPMFPGWEARDNLFVPPAISVLTPSLGLGMSGFHPVYRPSAYWTLNTEATEYLLYGSERSDSTRDALRKVVVRASQEIREDEKTIPDFWQIATEAPQDGSTPPRLGEVGHTEPTVTLRKVATNITDDSLEGLKSYVTGEAAARKAAEFYNQMRNELSTIGIVMDDVGERGFLKLLTGDAKALEVKVSDGLRQAEGRTGHHVLVDLVTGAVDVSCHYVGQDATAMPEAWEEAQTLATLTGREEAFESFSHKYVNTIARNEVLERALSRRTQRGTL